MGPLAFVVNNANLCDTKVLGSERMIRGLGVVLLLVLVGLSWLWLGVRRDSLRAGAAADPPRRMGPVDAEREAVGASAGGPRGSLEIQCREQADEWRTRVSGQLAVVVCTPWILAGDMTAGALRQRYEDGLEPVCRAMRAEYFRTPPDRPLTALLFSREDVYRTWSERLFADREVSRFGYYKSGRRTLVVNLAEGDGPLWHEITHALLGFDLHRPPPWLDEGLATLHETAVLAPGLDGERLRGQTNWRLDVLRSALRDQRWPALRDLLYAEELAGSDAAVRYAQARYFCLFLQQEGRLAGYYRRLRERLASDPHGERTLREIYPDWSLAELDGRFRQWLRSLPSAGADRTLEDGRAGVCAETN
jgi:hypothetical protein